MTAFASENIADEKVSLSWEIRTVNHRYLDVTTYFPDGFQAQENTFKALIRSQLGRGKVDAKLVCERMGDAETTAIQINENVVKSLLNARRKLDSLSKKTTGLSAMEILSWSGVVEDVQTDYSVFYNASNDLLEKTLASLVNTRQSEGERINIMILKRCDEISDIVQSVRIRRTEVVINLKEKILQKVQEISTDIDNNRLEQELVYHVQRLDVDEELDRLDSHIVEVKIALKNDEPVGRRLDFLMQELNREANTLGSKANDADTTKAAINLKVLIEQMREQVMNVE